jgi:hypothetical protein
MIKFYVKKFKINKIKYFVAIFVIAASQLFYLHANVFAIFDKDFFSANDILILNPDDIGCGTNGNYDPNLSILKNGTPIDYAGNTVLSSIQIQAIKDNETVYENSANKAGIPWEVLAAVHYRETGLKVYGPSNGNGPYQIVGSKYPISDSYTQQQFQAASDDAAAFIKNKSGGRDLSNLDNVMFTLFAYNGAASQYISQAKALGFTDQEAGNGAGSPYVMNQMDQKRDPRVDPTKTNNTWGQIVSDGGSISYPANSGGGQYGAFVIYSLLVGADISGLGCGNSASIGKNGDVGAIQAEFAAYMQSHGNRYGSYVLGSNGCTTLSSWYIGEHTNLTYGQGNGKEVVGNLVARNPGLKISSTPVAPSLFSVAGGAKTWGGSGGSYGGSYPGHVGLVVSVDETNKTAQVVATGSSYATGSAKSFTATYSYPDSAVTFVYLGDNLK